MMSVFVKIKDFILEIIELFLEVMAEIVLPFIKKEIVFIFKEHPIVTVLIVFTSIVVSTTIGLASPRHTEVKEEVQNIVIAETEKAPTYKKVEMEHEVHSGETLLGLACMYSKEGESANEWISNVKQMNNIKNVNWIKSGSKIKIYTWERVQ